MVMGVSREWGTAMNYLCPLSGPASAQHWKHAPFLLMRDCCYCFWLMTWHMQHNRTQLQACGHLCHAPRPSVTRPFSRKLLLEGHIILRWECHQLACLPGPALWFSYKICHKLHITSLLTNTSKSTESAGKMAQVAWLLALQPKPPAKPFPLQAPLNSWGLRNINSRTTAVCVSVEYTAFRTQRVLHC